MAIKFSFADPTSLPRRKKFINRKIVPDGKRKPVVRRKANSNLIHSMQESEPESVESFDGEDAPDDERSIAADDNE